MFLLKCHIASDINKGRIAMADGCELSVTEVDGAKIYEVVKATANE